MSEAERAVCEFEWEKLGDLETGRPSLGMSTSVRAYRLMHFAIQHVLACEFGAVRAEDLVRRAGHVAGVHWCRNTLDLSLGLNDFVAQLQRVLRDERIGILRVERLDAEHLGMTLTVAEDLECSGLPMGEATVCFYDEGFIAGILEGYTGLTFEARETDCWATGGRVCRFEVKLRGTE